ncbi:MAG: hypothetical protein ACD_51C00283G0043 [uncultured bacterium]|nr:MAG: hypothetical protein ACD_51C00283G0043 [uncultured bacterium]OGJ48464.1 MAG: hypothetical protein A2244_05580 [Candidatus Peregrinibacteria bacterium RIFOXYA2_FULL_41_18]
MHTKDKNQIFKTFSTGIKGLSSSQIKELQKKYGSNEIKGKRKVPLIIQFFGEFKDLMILILIAAAVLAGLGGKMVDMSVILGIVVLNALIGFIQKFKAEKAIEALKRMVQPHAKVIRDGNEKIIDARDLVPGDILLIEEGDQVSADARLIETNNLEMDESTLTGEFHPVKKTSEIIEKKQLNLDERENTIFMGTSVIKGNGRAVVIKTGMETMFGQIAHLTTSTKKDLSPLQKELFKLGVFAGKITLVISIILFGVGYFIQGTSFAETILFATSVAVAAVPEGLPATITIALALGVQRLAKKNAIMKQLSSVETLGSTTVICTDKTGTITKNEMTVKNIFIPGYNMDVTGVGYEPRGALHITGTNVKISLSPEPDDPNDEFEDHNLNSLSEKNLELHTSLKFLSQAATLCNNSKLVQEKDKWKIIGDPTEGSLLTASEKMGFETIKTFSQWKRMLEVPFSSEKKTMAVVCSSKYEKEAIVLIKGAPDVIMSKCTRALVNNHLVEITKQLEKEIRENNDRMANSALRVLGFAYKTIKKEKKYEEKDTEGDMIFIGLMGMMDPPRQEVPQAVELTHKAGVKTYIITGDYGPTAEAIARQVGMVSSKNPRIITGAELETFSEIRLSKVIKTNDEIIFSRVSPEHKLKIISALKKNGEIVAMTGDGVNDAPALKRADIGIAMGIAGTDVSREASNMVLADDSYGTIVTAIEEGRKIYQNLRKFVFYTFSCNIGELITIFASIILGLPAPLTAVLILCVDLGTDVLPAIALGVETGEPDIMEKPPRNPKERILKKSFIFHFAYLGIFIGSIVTGYFYFVLKQYNYTEGNEEAYLKAATSAFILLVFIQMWSAVNSRSFSHSAFKIGFFKNPHLMGAILISILIAFCMAEIPYLQEILGTTHLTAKEWITIIAASSTIFILEELRKALFKGKLA